MEGSPLNHSAVMEAGWEEILTHSLSLMAEREKVRTSGRVREGAQE